MKTLSPEGGWTQSDVLTTTLDLEEAGDRVSANEGNVFVGGVEISP